MSQQLHIRTFGRFYLQAGGGGGGDLTARGPWPREWETFYLIPMAATGLRDGAPVCVKTWDGHYLSVPDSEVTAKATQPGTTETFTLVMATGEGPFLEHLRSFGLRAANGEFLCAEGGGNDIVVANRPVMAQWETFTAITEPAPSGFGLPLSLRALSGQFVCAEKGGGRELIANRASVGIWETFTLLAADRNAQGFPNGARVNIKTYDGHYLQAAGGGGGIVTAEGPWPREWETFTLALPAGTSSLSPGSDFGLRADGGQLVTAVGGGGGALEATVTSLGAAETFRYTDSPYQMTGKQRGPIGVISLSVAKTQNVLSTSSKSLSAPAEETSPDPDFAIKSRTVTLVNSDDADAISMVEPLADVIFPGNAVDGSSWANGGYANIGGSRRPITISSSLLNVPAYAQVPNSRDALTRKIAQPTLAVVRENLRAIVQATKDMHVVTPAELIMSSVEELQTAEELAVFLRARYNGTLARLYGAASYQQSRVRNYAVAVYMQRYFSIDMDTPQGPIFDDETVVTDETLYVASVAYGRLILFVAESDEETDRLSAALSIAVDEGVQSGSAYAEATQSLSKKTTRVRHLFYGGPAYVAQREIAGGLMGIRSALQEGKTMTDETLPVPISYTLRFAKGPVHPVAFVSLATTYQAREVTRIRGRIRLGNFTIRCKHKREGEPGNEAEIYGVIRVWKYDGQGKVSEEHVVWATDNNHWMSMTAGSAQSVGDYLDLEYDPWDSAYRSWGFKVEGHFWDQNTLGSDTELPRAAKTVPLTEAFSPDGSTLSADSYYMAVDFTVEPA